MKTGLIPVVCDETPEMKHGDVFTIAEDSPGLHVPKHVAEDNYFIAVPHNYESRTLKKIWAQRIAAEKLKLVSKRKLQNAS